MQVDDDPVSPSGAEWPHGKTESTFTGARERAVRMGGGGRAEGRSPHKFQETEEMRRRVVVGSEVVRPPFWDLHTLTFGRPRLLWTDGQIVLNHR